MTKEKAVAKKQSAEVPATDDFLQQDDVQLDQDDLIIPALIVAQKQHESQGVPPEAIGQLYVDVLGTWEESMRLAIIKMSKSRIMFPEKYVKDNPPLCRSHDFTYPANDIEGQEPMAKTCSECPYKEWDGKTPPACNEVWNLLVLDLETGTPMWFRNKSTALAPTKKLMSALKLKATVVKKTVHDFEFTVTVKERHGDSGDSYLPHFSDIVELSDEERQFVQAVRQNMLSMNVDAKDAAGDKDFGDQAPSTDQSEDDEEF